MPKHVTRARRNLVARLLGARFTYRQISERCHVSRGTVARVARELTRPDEVPVGVAAMPAAKSTFIEPQKTVSAYKCRCGYVVTLRPCVICQAMKARREERKRMGLR